MTRSVAELPGSGPRAPGGALGRQIAVNSLLSLAGRVTYVIGWALITPWMLHRLGADRFGLWSLVTVVSGVYLSLDLGLASTLTRFVAEFRASSDRGGLRGAFTMGAALYFLLSLVFLAAVWLLRDPLVGMFRITPALQGEARTAIVVAAASYGMLNAAMLVASVLGGLQRMDVWNRISMATTLLQLAGVVLVLSLGGGIPALLVNSGVSLLIGAVWGWWVVRRLEPRIGWDSSRFDPALGRRLLGYGAALQVINAGVLVQFQLDKVLFGSMLSLRAAGAFELANRAISALWSAPSLMLPPLIPAAAHLDARGDRERVERLHRRASRYVLAVAFPIAAGTVALAPALFAAWLGPGHLDSARAGAALAAMLGVNILTGVGTAIARGLGRPGLEVRYQALAMALHLAASLVLIPRYGFTGGLWALFLSTSIASLYFVVGFQRMIGESLLGFGRDVVLPPLAAALAGALAAGWLGGALDPRAAEWSRTAGLLHLASGAAAMLIVTGGLLVAWRALTLDDLRALGGVVRRREAFTLVDEPRDAV